MSDKHKYSIVIETIKKMYEDKKITIAQVKSSLNKKIISLDEYDYILGKK